MRAEETRMGRQRGAPALGGGGCAAAGARHGVGAGSDMRPCGIKEVETGSSSCGSPGQRKKIRLARRALCWAVGCGHDDGALSGWMKKSEVGKESLDYLLLWG